MRSGPASGRFDDVPSRLSQRDAPLRYRRRARPVSGHRPVGSPVAMTRARSLLGRPIGFAGDVGEAALGTLAGVWGSVAQGRAVHETQHRPWPMPSARWVMAQTWNDLLFAHWPIPFEVLRPLVPRPLTLDTFDGSAWLGITPFEVSGLRARGLPPPPRISRFPELNVRTYATFAGKPGIVFFSLDAGSTAAVAGARRSYRLPYFRAEMAIARSKDEIRYRSVRTSSGVPAAELDVRYGPAGEAQHSVPGTLEHWLTERYCLYTVDEHRQLRRAEIHHPPWPLQPAVAEIRTNTMAPTGAALPDTQPLLHFARRQDVVIWPPATVG
jgi:uncharacterized protein